MDRKRNRKTRFQIPVSSNPRPYRPGDGPPLAPLTIVPENDSNAFIADKRVLIGTAANGEPKLQMYYVVGWPDLPAARVPILATEVYDYVSQRTVEDFEYKESLERDEEEQRKEAEKRRRAEVAAAKKKAKSTNATYATSVINTPTTPSTPTGAGQKRRGRPSKAALQARQLTQAILDNPTDIDVPLPPVDASGPSLSTPQKKRTGEFATDIDEDEADADSAIFRQLCGDNSDVDDMDVDNNEDDELLPSAPEVVSSSAETNAHARDSSLKEDTTIFKCANGKLAMKSSNSYVPVPEVLRSNKQFPPKPLPPKLIPPQSTTPIPVPSPFQVGTKIYPSNPLDNKKYFNTPIPCPTPLRSNKVISQKEHPHKTPSHKETPRSKSLDGKQSITPVPVPSWSQLTNGAREPSASAPPAPITTSPSHHGFTPAGRSSGKWPSTSSQPLDDTAQVEGTGQKNTKERQGSPRPKKKPKHQHVPKEAEEGQQVWVVERLESDRLVRTEDGEQEYYFKVRWEGEWPPDQNPTWEPEKNIAPHLVKRYWKKKNKAGRDHHWSPKQNGSMSKQLLKRKYSSVMEAFEGTDEEIPNQLANTIDEAESDGQEEVLVVAPEEQSLKSPKSRSAELEAKFLRDLAAAISSPRGK